MNASAGLDGKAPARELSLSEIGRGILLVRSLVDRDECAWLIARAPSFSPARLRMCGRNNLESFAALEAFADALKSRLRSQLAVREVDDLVEFYKYRVGHSIAEHEDSRRRMRRGVWSTAALLIYLNDDFEGGRTIFPKDDLEVAPIATQALLFQHGVTHLAEAVTKGTKLVARLNVAL